MNCYSDFDNYLIPYEDFLKSYFECRKHKRNTINALQFEINYEKNLLDLCYEVNNRTYEIGYSICFLVTRPKLREVFAADFRDRIIHHVIMSRLEPLFETAFIKDNYNCRKGKGTLYGIYRLREQIRQCSEDYTKHCVVGKFDLQGFFMSIHKPTLWKNLKSFIEEKYNGKDKNLLLYLVEKVVMHCPEKKCNMRSPLDMWNLLPKDKSLFTCGDEYGLPIGNLTSQCFANFYLHIFDNIMKLKFTYYGRYVDDFYVVTRDKEKLKKTVDGMEKWLIDNLQVKLHPNKRHIQNYEKGTSFIGAVVKSERLYVVNTTVSNIYKKIHSHNKHIKKCNIESFVCSLNSYFGLMKHYNSFNVKGKILKRINNKWFKYISYNKKKNIFEIKQEYKPIQFLW